MPRLRSPFWILTLTLLAFLTATAGADDRDLLRQGQSDPYVFVLLDVSGSMNQSVPCSAEDAAAGNCVEVCPSGACLPRRVSDDPDSRLRVAREAIHEIMEETDNVFFGFGSFDQDGLRAFRKHWWYRLKPAAEQSAPFIELDSNRPYPGPGFETIFGETWNCDEGRDDGGNPFEPERFIGCEPRNPADLDDAWEDERVRRWPKLDDDNDTDRTYFIRDAGQVYKVTFRPVGGQTLGAPEIRAEVEVERCNNANCTNDTPLGRNTYLFEQAGPMIYWEPGEGISRTAPGEAFFGSQGGVRQSGQNGNNTGLELNDDSGDDEFGGISLKVPTRPDPLGRGAAYSIGDLIPFDWEDDHRTLIQERMAPNLIRGDPVPDFGVASYFEDHPNGNGLLELRDPDLVPLFPRFGTPTGRAMERFRMWFEDWLQVATDATDGDPNLPCRSFNLVVVTDGLASDGVAACGHANQLREFRFQGEAISVRSFAVALGNPDLNDPTRRNVLNCIADNGGSGETDHNGDGEPDGPGPLFPQNKGELVDAFNQIFELIATRNRSFAAAAVPQAQANTEDKIFLTNFTPVPTEPIWAGRIDGYLRPIPLVERLVPAQDGTLENRLVPDRSEVCAADDESACRLWDTGQELLEQAPDATQLAAGDFNLGDGEDQRRTYYAKPQMLRTPEVRRFFEPPNTDEDWKDLLVGMEVCDLADPNVDTCAASSTNRGEARRVFPLIYGKKIFENPDTGNDQEYVLGDVFHSNPRVVGAPDNFRYFVADFFGNGNACDDATNPNRGYRCYFERQRFRRNVLFVGSNDGQLHAFDAGVFRGSLSGGQVVGEFDNGTGRELFSFVPRPVMPTLRDMADPSLQTRHRFTVDGTTVNADVFVDPFFTVSPNPDERRWRTYVIGGLREGGSGYYALDVTRPDTLDTNNLPEPRGGSSGFLPSCSNGGAGCGPVPWPSVAWEFTDSEGCTASVAGGACDDDANGLADLGDSWSTPNVGIIQVCSAAPCDLDPDTGNVERRFVAVFGGGLDPARKRQAAQEGNHLYMVDMETGKVLYKRELQGGAPSTPAAVDTDQDGILDTVYIGTTLGFLYKVDLSQPIPLETLPGIGDRLLDPSWDPFALFTTGGRPIFFPPSVIFVAARGQFALAFGTGDREDLWEQAPNDDGRFYLFVDDGLEPTTVGLPFDESDLRNVDVNPAPNADADFLLDSGQTLDGWFLPLEDDERVITQAFSLGGVTSFSTFQPFIDRRTLGGNDVVCANRGRSRVFVVFTTNAEPVFGSGERFRVVPDLVTEPFTETGAIKNDTSGSGDGPTADDVDQDLQAVIESLKRMFPDDCRFANYTINIKALRSDTGVEFIAPVPVCITQRNWKEF